MFEWEYIVIVGVLVGAMLATKLIVVAYQSFGRDPSDLRITSGKHSALGIAAVTILYVIQAALVYYAQVHVHGRPFELLGFDDNIASGFVFGTLGGLLIFSLPKMIAFATARERQFRTALPRDETHLYVFGILAFLFVALLANSCIEELVFRAYPIEQLRGKSFGAGFAILISALLFSLIHHIIEPFSLPPFLRRLLIGVIYGELYVLSGSIWLLIGVHTGSNLAALVFCGQWRIGGVFHVKHDRPGIESTLGWVLGASAILGLGILASL